MNVTRLTVFTLLFIWHLLVPTSLQADVEIILDRFEQIGTTEFFDASDYKVKRSGRDRKLYGKFEHKIEIDNSITVRIDSFMKTGVGWNMLPYKIVKPFCEFFVGDEYFYPELAKYSDAPFPINCPVPAVSSIENNLETEFSYFTDFAGHCYR